MGYHTGAWGVGFCDRPTILSSGYGTGLIALGLFGFFYHLANGLRHLCWDRGYGYDIKNVYRSGWIVVACSITAGIVAILIAL